MNNKRIITIKEGFNKSFPKDKVYEMSDNQSDIIHGIMVKQLNGEDLLIPHGSYEEYIEEGKATSITEEKIFVVLLKDNLLLSEKIKEISKEIKENFYIELDWFLKEEIQYPFGKEDCESLLILTTFKDSNKHLSTPLWIKACETFVYKLGKELNQNNIKAYCTNVSLYNFEKQINS